jgi:hypothetical protein
LGIQALGLGENERKTYHYGKISKVSLPFQWSTRNKKNGTESAVNKLQDGSTFPN